MRKKVCWKKLISMKLFNIANYKDFDQAFINTGLSLISNDLGSKNIVQAYYMPALYPLTAHISDCPFSLFPGQSIFSMKSSFMFITFP